MLLAPPSKKRPGLEGGDHGVAEAERVGLELRPVLARRVGVRVGADRRRDDAACVDAGSKREAPHEHEQGDRRNPSSLSPPHEPPDRTPFGGFRLAPSGRRELDRQARRLPDADRVAAGRDRRCARRNRDVESGGGRTLGRRLRSSAAWRSRTPGTQAVLRRTTSRCSRRPSAPGRLCEPGEPERPCQLRGCVHVAPPSVEETKPTERSHVLELQRGDGIVVVRERQPGRVARGRTVDREARDEVVGATRRRVDRDPDRRRPRQCRSVAVHMTMSFECSPSGNGSPARRRRPGHRRRPRPREAARVRRFPATVWSVTRRSRRASSSRRRRRSSGTPGSRSRCVRHDDGPVGLHHGLAAQAGFEPPGRGRRAPRETPVRRRAHEDLLAHPEVVPLRVAVPVVRALRPRVAGDPVLVEERARPRGCRDRRCPRQASVGRAAGQNRARRPERRRARPERERRDHPDVVHRVVRHGGIADPRPGPAGVAKTVVPGSMPVVQVRPAFVVVAQPMLLEPPPALNRPVWNVATTVLPKPKRVGLDLSPVLARLSSCTGRS